jgi:hypothetical protein
MFEPLTRQGLHRIAYGEWFLKFCVSISWRVLLLAREEGTSGAIPNADKALETWRRFLRGELPHPAGFEQHCIPFGTVDADDRSRLPGNINRYVLRAIEIDIPRSNDFCFSYAKMGPIAVLGFTDLKNPKEWPSSKVHLREGTIGGRVYQFPQELWTYWEDRSRRYGRVSQQISPRQRAIANQSAASAATLEPDRVANSHWFRAMQQDFELLGGRAFEEGWPKSDRKG